MLSLVDSAAMETEQEQFGKRLATIFVMVGVAVGLGNVWRFPYMMGAYGGGTFLFIYILAMSLFGVPALIAEWALGQAKAQGLREGKTLEQVEAEWAEKEKTQKKKSSRRRRRRRR